MKTVAYMCDFTSGLCVIHSLIRQHQHCRSFFILKISVNTFSMWCRLFILKIKGPVAKYRLKDGNNFHIHKLKMSVDIVNNTHTC